ncbi:MAG: hypothetical protein JXR36_12570 [Bacteroidales bacterium]|nr:hypothetical protein [Bacteroidales bacterium]
MEKSYDLTTYKGVNKALDIFKKYGWVINPIPWLVFKALSPELSTEKQVEAAKTLIEAGKTNGVKRMRIKIGHKAGLELSTLLQGFPIKVMMGNNGIAEVEVDYESNSSGIGTDVNKV